MKPDMTHPDPYKRTFRFPKWNKFVRVTEEHRLFKRIPEFRDWPKSRHIGVSIDYLTEAISLQKEYDKVVRASLTVYGNHGPLISGVIRDHFPPAVKDGLRDVCHKMNEFRDRSIVHWQAGGRRIHTWITLRDRLEGR